MHCVIMDNKDLIDLISMDLKPCELWVLSFAVGLLDSGSLLVVELSASVDSSERFCCRFDERISAFATTVPVEWR